MDAAPAKPGPEQLQSVESSLTSNVIDEDSVSDNSDANNYELIENISSRNDSSNRHKASRRHSTNISDIVRRGNKVTLVSDGSSGYYRESHSDFLSSQQLSSDTSDAASNMSVDSMAARIKEMVPSLDMSVIMTLIEENNHNFIVCLDKGLALSELIEDTKSSVTTSGTRGNSVAALGGLKSDIYHSRGIRRGKLSTPLPKNFLAVPKYRIIIKDTSPVSLDYSVIFDRRKDMIGITITSNNKYFNVVVESLDPNGLARKAGIKKGDILTGVDSDRFGPDVMERDVLDLISLLGGHITLHFSRRSDFYEIKPHKLAVMLSNFDSVEDIDHMITSHQRNSVISRSFSNRDDSMSISAQSGYSQSNIVQDSLAKAVCYISLIITTLKLRVLQWDKLKKVNERKIIAWKSYDISDKFNWSTSGGNSAIRRNVDGALYGSHTSPDRQTASINDKSKRRMSLPASITPPTSVSHHSPSYRSPNNSNYHYDPISKHSLDDLSKARIENQNVVELRPAICVRLIRAESLPDHVVYVIWVYDVRCGHHWLCRRRFSEFYELRQGLIKIKPDLEAIPFPGKRFLFSGETPAVVQERLKELQTFMQRFVSMVAIHTITPTIIAIQLLLQNFLDFDSHYGVLLELEQRPQILVNNMVHVFVCSIIQLDVMGRYFSDFVQRFDVENENSPNKADGVGINLFGRRMSTSAGSDALNKAHASELLNAVKSYLNEIQGIIFNCIKEDCFQIINHYRLKKNNQLKAASKWRDMMDQFYMYNNGKSTADDDLELEEQRIHFQRLSEDELIQISFNAIRQQIEIEVYVPLRTRIYRVVSQAYKADEEKFRAQVQILKRFPQTFFGISAENCSPTNWDEVVRNFKRIPLMMTPHEKLELLMETAKGIPALFQKEHPECDPNAIQKDSEGSKQSVEALIRHSRSGSELERHSSLKPDTSSASQSLSQQESSLLNEFAASVSKYDVGEDWVNNLPEQSKGSLDSSGSESSATHSSSQQSAASLMATSPRSSSYVLKNKPHDNSKSTSHGQSRAPLGADETLPIFIYVCVQAEIPDMLTINAEMQSIVDEEKLLSETGYYLATLEAAIAHIQRWAVDRNGDATW